jgi:hypothetical protein
MNRLANNCYPKVLLSILLIYTCAWAADTPAPVAVPPKAATIEPGPAPAVRKPVAEMVRVISFRLKDGRTVTGRVVNDDRTQVTVAEFIGGKIVPNMYSRQEMEPRSITYQSVSEYQYWITAGQYFESHTWDWQDDADEFAQALRCYQTAQDLATIAMGKDSAAAVDARERARKLLDSRQRWIDTAKPRAEMAELELKSTLGQKLETMNKSIAGLRLDVDALNNSRTNVDAAISAFQKDTNARLDAMSTELRRVYDYVRTVSYNQPGSVVIPQNVTP